jgi:hypothetical protein
MTARIDALIRNAASTATTATAAADALIKNAASTATTAAVTGGGGGGSGSGDDGGGGGGGVSLSYTANTPLGWFEYEREDDDDDDDDDDDNVDDGDNVNDDDNNSDEIATTTTTTLTTRKRKLRTSSASSTFVADQVEKLKKDRSVFISASKKQWPLPLIKRCCVVFETRGERRLADHVLAGVDRLMPMLLPSECRSGLCASCLFVYVVFFVHMCCF